MYLPFILSEIEKNQALQEGTVANASSKKYLKAISYRRAGAAGVKRGFAEPAGQRVCLDPGPKRLRKTTLLNIIGGLDRYDSGDLLINGVSTKEYKDRDWDSYRNHSIGFVFQSYNLIPHQSILQTWSWR